MKTTVFISILGLLIASTPLAEAHRKTSPIDSALRRANVSRPLVNGTPVPSQVRSEVPKPFRFPVDQKMNGIVPGQLLVKTFPSRAETIVQQAAQGRPGLASQILPEGRLLNRLAETGWTLWEIPVGLDPKGFAEVVKKRPGVLHAQAVNRIYPLLGQPNDPDWLAIETSENLILNFGEEDISFRRMWTMTDVFAHEGWSKWPNRFYTAANKPANAPIIAVIDTGLDMDHPDYRNAGGTTTNTTGGGQIIHSLSKQFRFGAIDPQGTPMDTNGHGTHVAGIALAAGNSGSYNGRGIIGTGYGARGMILRVFDDTGNGSDADAAAAIFYAADQGADVINLSLGTRNFSQVFQDATTYAWQKGTLVVVACNESGSGGGDIGPIYPAACSGALSVTANGPDFGSAATTYAGAGQYVDLAAPGGDVVQSIEYYILQFVYSTSPRYFAYLNTPGLTFPQFEQEYAYLLGTSMACPHVAGAGAMFYDMHNLRQNSGWANVKAYQAIERSALPVAMAPNGGWEAVQGYGCLDMELLLDPYDTNARAATVGSVEGIVYYNGTALANAVVKAQALTGGTIYQTTTKADGTYRFDQLPSVDGNPAIYRIETTAFGNVRAKNTPIIVGSDVSGFDFWVNGLVTDEDGNIIVYNADDTPPVIQRFNIKSVRSGVMTVDHWGYDTETGLRRIQVRVGTTPGGQEALAPTEIFPIDPIARIPVNLSEGRLYYVTVVYTNNDGDTSTVTKKYMHVRPDFDAVVEQTILLPENATAGQNVNIQVRVRNTGTRAWQGTMTPMALVPSYSAAETGWTPTPVQLPANVTVKPGNTYTFSFSRTAPAVGGAWRVGWNLAHMRSRAGSFGDQTPMRFLTVN